MHDKLFSKSSLQEAKVRKNKGNSRTKYTKEKENRNTLRRELSSELLPLQKKLNLCLNTSLVP